ncbi:MAG: class I SAM-dependent methyltransferase [Alphaproteobacteria bacterium]|nr:class I SAM-dependent methyltransferase [Alphaproteobacteria bacterium]MBU1514240.1 class I SAM-dependent methyltransferase [Alphaproteobacteria bacterium]MBU2093314.1 class I SAM-dependent methyltransferase [Alphaproteobacteria bacterium]MBU2153405.1 class I SAM-dependent methyltransferase [Alphaproteobacteria bacterium]MBU2307096.1 class I SAM-dependent methyltransferase [Alphaproteobacteria bacterium]
MSALSLAANNVRDVAHDMPGWAAAAFPHGLAHEGGSVWAPYDYSWDMGAEARINQAASNRSGGGADVSLHFEVLLRAALAQAGIDTATDGVLLDLRSGDGVRSLVPWLSLLPRVHIVASDPSSLLLAAAVGRARSLEAEDRVMGVLAEPDGVPVAPGSVDLVSGVACLHELDDPDLVLAAAARALRPGGVAIFLAPFDGHGLLRLAYERIWTEAALWPDDPLSPDIAVALRAVVDDITKRTLPDRRDPAFAQMEQKWLFARESLEAAARSFGFREVDFASHNDHETLYRDAAVLQVRTLTGRADAVLPVWAMDILDGFDRALRPPVKRLLMLEGTIVLRR